MDEQYRDFYIETFISKKKKRGFITRTHTDNRSEEIDLFRTNTTRNTLSICLCLEFCPIDYVVLKRYIRLSEAFVRRQHAEVIFVDWSLK